ncbi:MAG: hypothetical protein V1893_03950 [Candidatus Omnitrophota bacterium]
MLRIFFLFLFILLTSTIAGADIIYLKNGGKVEGKIINISEEGYEVTVKSGTVFIKKEEVARTEERPVDVSKTDSITQDTEVTMNGESEEKEPISKSPYDIGMSRQNSPDVVFDNRNFEMYLATYKDENKKNEYLGKCLLEAEQAETKAHGQAQEEMVQQNLFRALDFYRKAAFSSEPSIGNPAKEAIGRLMQKLIKSEEGKLAIPKGRVYREINELLAGLTEEEALVYCNGYLEMGKKVESEADAFDINSQQYKEKIRSALNCYLIVYNFTGTPQIKKEVLTSIKRCNKRL